MTQKKEPEQKFYQMTYREIAAVLGVSYVTVINIEQSALRKLKKELAQQGRFKESFF